MWEIPPSFCWWPPCSHYFNSLASAAGVHEDLYLSYWGYAGSLATVLVALLGPGLRRPG